MKLKKVVASLLLFASLAVPTMQSCFAARNSEKSVEIIQVEQSKSKQDPKKLAKRSLARRAGKGLSTIAKVGIASYAIYSGRRFMKPAICDVKDLLVDTTKLARFANQNLTTSGKVALLTTTAIGSYAVAKKTARVALTVLDGIHNVKKEVIDRPIEAVKKDVANAAKFVKGSVTRSKKQRDSKNEARKDFEVTVKFNSVDSDAKSKADSK